MILVRINLGVVMMTFPKIAASLLAGAGFLTSAMAADAATIGGASLSVSNGLIESAAIKDPTETIVGYDFNISGDFFMETLITDFDAVRDYDVTVKVWDAAGVPTFNLSLPVPDESINGLLDGLGMIGVLDLLSPILTEPTGAINIAGLDVDYSYSNLAYTANSIAGTFALALAVDINFLAFADAFLGLGVSTPPESAAFSAEFAISAVPVPAALPLALTGAALLGGLGLRRRRARAAA